jgi:hypothetical protein
MKVRAGWALLLLVVALLFLAWAGPASAQPIDVGARVQDIAAVASAYPEEWWAAHRDGYSYDQQRAFNRRVAAFLHFGGLAGARTILPDPRIGLNGKRGVCADQSMDALSVRGFRSQLDSGDLVVVDFIAGAGGPDPRVDWQWDVGGTSCWITPDATLARSAAPPPPPPPPPPPGPDLTAVIARLDAISSQIVALDQRVREACWGTDEATIAVIHTAAQAALRAEAWAQEVRNTLLAEGLGFRASTRLGGVHGTLGGGRPPAP